VTSKILFVFEGKKTEPQIHRSVAAHFFSGLSSSTVVATYNTDIYTLHQEISSDPFLDIVELVRPKNKEALAGITRAEIAEVFLFFDHDAHSSEDIAKLNSAIGDMLATFDNETDRGKLYISYPMVEAIKDCGGDFNLCGAHCVHAISANNSYKAQVSKRTPLMHLRRFTRATWDGLTVNTLMKATCLLFEEYRRPTEQELEMIDQKSVFTSQVSKQICNGNVAILSGFPFFLVDYFGADTFLSS